MKREFLKALELSDEVIDKIMAENGKDIEAEKSKTASYKQKFETSESDKAELETKIEELQTAGTDNEKVKKELEDLKKKIEDDKKATEAKRADDELTAAITAVFGDKKFTSDYVKNGIIADMKSEIAKPENKAKGYDKIFEELTDGKEGIFVSPNQVQMGDFGNIDTDITTDQLRAAMGLDPEAANK